MGLCAIDGVGNGFLPEPTGRNCVFIEMVFFPRCHAGFRRDEGVQIGARPHEPVPARIELAAVKRVGRTRRLAGN